MSRTPRLSSVPSQEYPTILSADPSPLAALDSLGISTDISPSSALPAARLSAENVDVFLGRNTSSMNEHEAR